MGLWGQLKWARGGDLVHSPAQIRQACSGICPVGSWKLPRRGTVQPLCMTCPVFRLSSWGKSFSLNQAWNSLVSCMDISVSFCHPLALVQESSSVSWWPLVGTEGLLDAPKVISSPDWGSPAPPAPAHTPRTSAPTALEHSKSSLQFSHVFPALQVPELNALSGVVSATGTGRILFPWSVCHAPVHTHRSCWLPFLLGTSCAHAQLAASHLPGLFHRAAPQYFHLSLEKSLDYAFILGPYHADVYLFHCVGWNTKCHPNMHSS